MAYPGDTACSEQTATLVITDLNMLGGVFFRCGGTPVEAVPCSGGWLHPTMGAGRFRFRACLCWASVAVGVRYRALLMGGCWGRLRAAYPDPDPQPRYGVPGLAATFGHATARLPSDSPACRVVTAARYCKILIIVSLNYCFT